MIDGRTSNARYLKNNFKEIGANILIVLVIKLSFLLDEKPLGRFNKEQIKFYNTI